MSDAEQIREILSDEFPETEYNHRVHSAVKRISKLHPANPVDGEQSTDNFYQWLQVNGVELDDQLDDGDWRANIDMNKLKLGIAVHLQAAVKEAQKRERNRMMRIPIERPLEYAPQPISPEAVPLEYEWVTVGRYYDERNHKASEKWYEQHKSASAIVVNEDGDALYALYVSPLGSHNESVDHLFKNLRVARYSDDELQQLNQGGQESE